MLSGEIFAVIGASSPKQFQSWASQTTSTWHGGRFGVAHQPSQAHIHESEAVDNVKYANKNAAATE